MVIGVRKNGILLEPLLYCRLVFVSPIENFPYYWSSRGNLCGPFLPFLCRKMTFGRVSDLGQFIRESEPEPDVKKSKGLLSSFNFNTHMQNYSLLLFSQDKKGSCLFQALFKAK